MAKASGAAKIVAGNPAKKFASKPFPEQSRSGQRFSAT